MRKTYLYMTAVVMSAALATGCQKAEPVETTAAAETVAESTGTGTAENESSETSGTAAQDDERLADYHLLQGIVTGTNDEKGTFTLKADDGGEYVITPGLSSEASRMCIRLWWKPRQRSQIFNGGDRWKDGGSLYHYGRQSAF